MHKNRPQGNFPAGLFNDATEIVRIHECPNPPGDVLHAKPGGIIKRSVNAHAICRGRLAVDPQPNGTEQLDEWHTPTAPHIKHRTYRILPRYAPICNIFPCNLSNFVLRCGWCYRHPGRRFPLFDFFLISFGGNILLYLPPINIERGWQICSLHGTICFSFVRSFWLSFSQFTR